MNDVHPMIPREPSAPEADRLGIPDAGAVETVDGSGVLPLISEVARVDRRVVETGRVRVSTRTEAVDEVVRESLRSEAVGVTRVPVNRELAPGEPAPQIRTEGGLTIIPVLEEVLVVEKRLVLREEVHLQRTASAEDVAVPVTLRRQHAEVEHAAVEDAIASGPAGDGR